MTRRWPMAAAGALAMMLAGATGCGLIKPGSSNPSGCINAPTTVTGQTAAAATGVGDGGIRVVESGFTQLGPNKTVASVGAILENTSQREAAHRTRVTFRITGVGGGTVVPAGSGELLIQEIPIILPKQKIPVGAWTYVEGQITSATIELGNATWLPQTQALAQITTTFQSLSRTSSDPETATVGHIVTSPYCQELNPRGAAMVFRDTAGAIVGGSFELGAAKCPAGASTQRATADRSVPTTIDESKTQTYPYCDFAPAPPKTTGSPVN